MLRLTVDVAATDTARRLIEGTAVPYGEIAEIGWQRYRFAPGSIRAARSTTPLLLGHDTNLPVGVLAQLTDANGGARISARVDRTEDGDRALEQARSGSRSGLSIGFEIDEYTEADGIVDVSAASLYECSLVAVPAFAGATVDRVAAQRDAGEHEEEEEEAGEHERQDEEEAGEHERQDEEEEEAGDAGEHEPDTTEEEETMETEERSAERRTLIRAERRMPAMRAGEMIQTMVRAQRGDTRAAERLQAALSAVTSVNEPGVLPAAQTTEILGTVDQDRALFDTFSRSSPPLPSTGLAINKPKWTVKPDGGWIADGAATPSNAAAIDSDETPIDQWAWGILASYAVVERSTPDFAEAVYREAIADYYTDMEDKIADAIVAASEANSATLGGAVAAFVGARRSRPNVLLVGGGAYGDYLDATGPQYPLYTTGAVDASGNVSEYIAGLRLVLASFLPADAQIVTHTSALDVREQTPVKLSANVIGVNSVELGVYQFAYVAVDKADAFYPIGAVAPLEGKSKG